MKISAVLHHVHRGQLPHVSLVPGKLKLFIFVCNIGNILAVHFFCELFCYNPLIYTYTCIPT